MNRIFFLLLFVLCPVLAGAQSAGGSYYEPSDDYYIHIGSGRFTAMKRDTNTYLIDTLAYGNYKQKNSCIQVKYKKNDLKERKETIEIKDGSFVWRGMTFKKEIHFVKVEEMPSFPGGNGALMEYLSKNLKYPEETKEKGLQGRTIVRFTVKADGTLHYIQVLRSVDPALNRECARLIKSMPTWNPGKQNGHPVDVDYVIPFSVHPQ